MASGRSMASRKALLKFDETKAKEISYRQSSITNLVPNRLREGLEQRLHVGAYFEGLSSTTHFFSYALRSRVQCR